MKNPVELTIPPLISGGIMLSYRCTNACRHCLYRCSPRQPDEWLSLETARRLFTALQREPSLQSLHLAGGEPTLKMDLLVEIMRLAVEMDLPVAYLETNASWCADRGRTRREMEHLREAGLPAILVSVSMFHNEFVPFSSTRNCVEIARDVFGPGNVILYLPQMYELLDGLPDDGTHTLAEFRRWAGLEDRPEVIPRLYQVIPAGRATEALRECYTLRPAEAFAGGSCVADLLSTTHFHIDQHGNLFTGLCAGIVPADIDDLHPRITPETHPIFCTLCAEGPFGLMEMAARRHGFTPRADGYASGCDLCFDVRRFLVGAGRFAELRPEVFYQVS